MRGMKSAADRRAPGEAWEALWQSLRDVATYTRNRPGGKSDPGDLERRGTDEARRLGPERYLAVLEVRMADVGE